MNETIMQPDPIRKRLKIKVEWRPIRSMALGKKNEVTIEDIGNALKIKPINEDGIPERRATTG